MPILKVKKNGVWEEVAGTSGHQHTMNDITNFPSNLPADVLKLQNLVGDISVASQIADAVSDRATIDHVHDNILQLFDTISGINSVVVSNAVPDCELDITLTSENYTDFSNVTVKVKSNDEYLFRSSVANSDGTVNGLNSFSNFTLTLSSNNLNIDLNRVVINCTYPIDLNKLLVNKVIHADEIVIDDTLTQSGAAADAKATGDAISGINSKINSLADVASSGDYNDLINKPDITGSNVNVSDTYDATSGDAMSGKAVAEALKTVEVEQTQADWLQTDSTAIDYIKNKPESLGSGVSSWEDLTDKPFGETTVTATADPSTVTEVTYEGLGYPWIKISEETIPRESVRGAVIRYFAGGTIAMELTVTDSMIILSHENGIVIRDGYMAVQLVYKPGEIIVDVDGVTATVNPPEAGLYFFGNESPFSTEDERVVITGIQIKQLEQKYLPDNIGGDLPEVSADDAGKFLRVSADGTWVAETIPIAEEASF